MATTWTIAIDWDRDGEFSGDDIVSDSAVWVNGIRAPTWRIRERLPELRRQVTGRASAQGFTNPLDVWQGARPLSTM